MYFQYEVKLLINSEFHILYHVYCIVLYFNLKEKIYFL